MKLLLAICFLLAACAAPRPKTHTSAPALGASRTAIVDSKDAIKRARTLNERIEDKLIILEGK
jgi:uncharacterized lipoprotein YajG